MIRQPGGPRNGRPPQPRPSLAASPPGSAPAGRPPVVIDIEATASRQVIVGAVCVGAVGLISLVGGVAGTVGGGSAGAIGAMAIGLALLALALVPVLARRKVVHPRRLIFEPAGIRWDDPGGRSWAVAWPELAAVSISKHGKPDAGENVLVRLDLVPADPDFRARHPVMEHLWEHQGITDGYRVPLGRNATLIPLIVQGMIRFRPHIYRGVDLTEGFIGQV